MADTTNPDLLVAGIVGAARGLGGETSIQVRTDRAEEVFVAGKTLATSSAEYPLLTVIAVREHNGRLLVRFEGIDSREKAEALRGAELLVEPEEEENAWYARDLEGLRAVDPQGQPLGEVTRLLPGSAHDLLVVQHRGEDVMVPFVEVIVPEVDVEGGTVTIDPPLGLFPVEGNE